MKQNGVSVGEINSKLLQKIEELTMYVIEQNKIMVEQKKRDEQQAEIINELKQEVLKLK